MVIIVIALALMLAIVGCGEEQPTPQPPRTWQESPSPYDPNGSDRDCSDFDTQWEAQRFFWAAGGLAWDRHRLDGDGDGIVCELLP